MDPDVCTELRVRGNLARCSRVSPHLEDWTSASTVPTYCKCSPVFLSLQVTKPKVAKTVLRRPFWQVGGLCFWGHPCQAGMCSACAPRPVATEERKSVAQCLLFDSCGSYEESLVRTEQWRKGRGRITSFFRTTSRLPLGLRICPSAPWSAQSSCGQPAAAGCPRSPSAPRRGRCPWPVGHRAQKGKK